MFLCEVNGMGAYEALAASYDRLTNDVDYRATVDFYREILAQEGLHPRTAVDLACGTGSVSILLARQGLRVTGVDLSEEMLTVAQQNSLGNMLELIGQLLLANAAQQQLLDQTRQASRTGQLEQQVEALRRRLERMGAERNDR